ncbi:MarR family winged helix-turn-helix transcriptional regulator [Lichenihabitans psoromatis]|uniref:MarR family winged helix-turn-helix transcriptional regulator n=1 Tax=Lichenihabitans psoromatis TaxID=2528642 RepID=UPI001FE07D54|nr:MarR family transcriptional regulator [Lichenihabitans psoromatis]
MPRTTTSLLQRYCLGLLRSSRTWRQLADATSNEFDLSEATAYPLLFISRLGDGMRQAALAEHIGIEGPSLVRLLDQLCAADLVRRQEDSTDKRAKTLHLTDRGIALTAKLEERLNATRARIFAEVSPEDIAASLRVFAALERASQMTSTP